MEIKESSWSRRLEVEMKTQWRLIHGLQQRLNQNIVLLRNSYYFKASSLAARETYNYCCKPLLKSFTINQKMKRNGDEEESGRSGWIFFLTLLSRKPHNAFLRGGGSVYNQNVISLPPPAFPISQENCSFFFFKENYSSTFPPFSMRLSKPVAFG